MITSETNEKGGHFCECRPSYAWVISQVLFGMNRLEFLNYRLEFRYHTLKFLFGVDGLEFLTQSFESLPMRVEFLFGTTRRTLLRISHTRTSSTVLEVRTAYTQSKRRVNPPN
jgi:hypothetical protein